MIEIFRDIYDRRFSVFVSSLTLSVAVLSLLVHPLVDQPGHTQSRTPDDQNNPSQLSGDVPERSRSRFSSAEKDTSARSIRARDRIRVELGGVDWGGVFRVPPHGKIDFRFIGSVNVLNKTLNELEQQIRGKIKDYYRKPDLITNFVETTDRGLPPIYFGGHVGEQGPIQVGGPITFAKAISIARGFGQRAKPEQTKILRRDNRIQIINAVKQQDPSNLKDTEEVKLYPGDYVYIPGGQFDESVSEIYSAGAVANPGAGTVKDPVPFGVAISKTSKGLKSNARLDKVLITRSDGDTVIINGKKQLEFGKLPPDKRFYIKPGDYIYVPSEQSDRVEVTVLGAIGKPQKLEMVEGDGIMDALVKAGSLDNQGDRWKTYLFRKNENGDTTVKFASYSRYVQGDFSQNFELKDGDVIYVRTRFWPYFDTLQDVLQSIGYVTNPVFTVDRLQDLGD